MANGYGYYGLTGAILTLLFYYYTTNTNFPFPPRHFNFSPLYSICYTLQIGYTYTAYILIYASLFSTSLLTHSLQLGSATSRKVKMLIHSPHS